MTPILAGILGIALLLLLLAASLPVAFAMMAAGFAGFAAVVSFKAALAILAADFADCFSNHGLTVIPLFVFMGQICFHSGISSRLFNAAEKWMGHLPGGLALATVGACAFFGAICGSGPATAATMAAAAMPEMVKRRYSPSLAAGTVAAGGSLGMLVPPSVVLIVYGILTEQSIGKLFTAAVVPGVAVAVLFCIAISLRIAFNPSLAPAAPKASLKERVESLKGVAETLGIFLLVVGGIFTGLFTPTEGAAVGATGALAIAALSGRLTAKMARKALEETLRTSTMVLVIVAGASVFGHFLAVTSIPGELASWLSSLPLPSWSVIALIAVFYLVAGCFVDSLALVMLTVPIFYPVICKLGLSPLWFGVLTVVITQMGVITPPVGVNVYVVHGIDRSVPIAEVFRGAMPFLLALLLFVVAMIFCPAIATMLPDMLG